MSKYMTALGYLFFGNSENEAQLVFAICTGLTTLTIHFCGRALYGPAAGHLVQQPLAAVLATGDVLPAQSIRGRTISQDASVLDGAHARLLLAGIPDLSD